MALATDTEQRTEVVVPRRHLAQSGLEQIVGGIASDVGGALAQLLP